MTLFVVTLGLTWLLVIMGEAFTAHTWRRAAEQHEANADAYRKLWEDAAARVRQLEADR